MVDCDDQQWEHIIRVDSHARFIRNRPWPLWDDWKEIFGKDRASGTSAKDISDAAIRARVRANVPTPTPDSDYVGSLDENWGNLGSPATAVSESAGESPEGVDRGAPVTSKKAKRAKLSTHIGGMVDLLKQIHDDSNTRLEMLSTRIGYEVDLSKARKDAYEVLSTIDGLSMLDIFDIGEVLVANPARHDFFMGMPPIARPAYALRVLAEKRAGQV
ncbi:uncharacterized protein LOC121774185 [Salvia splendens]|nr:uncharacterized protein LOC121774185 [Salvia splendens]XP_042027036.1 uncharacterized protein LOC121774185 [Salvia splendens]